MLKLDLKVKILKCCMAYKDETVGCLSSLLHILCDIIDLTKISVETIISIDPDQTVLQEESDQGLHCLSKRNKA